MKSQVIAFLMIGLMGIAGVGIGVNSHPSLPNLPQTYDPIPGPRQMPIEPAPSTSITTIPVTMPSDQCRNISQTLWGYQSFLLGGNFTQDRQPDIMATLWAVLALKIVDPAACTLKKPAIVDFIRSKYNATSCHFEEPVAYPTAGWLGDDILQRPYQPHITHQAAVIILAELGVLSLYYNASTIDAWKAEIWTMKRPDKGFGGVFAVNSTITETFFAVYAMLALHQFSGLAFSAAAKQDVATYLISRFNAPDHFFMPYALREYDTDSVTGFGYYTVVWYLARIVAMLGLNPDLFNTQVRLFLLNNAFYNTQTHCFFFNYNDWLASTSTIYLGSAIWGEVLRILNIEGYFPDLPNVITTLKGGLRWNATGVEAGPNYFQSSNRTAEKKIIGLFPQYVAVLYLANKGELGNLEAQNPAHYAAFKTTMNRFFVPTGGASFVHPDTATPRTLYSQYATAKAIGSAALLPSEASLYTKIMATYGGNTPISDGGFLDAGHTLNTWATAFYPLFSYANEYFMHQYFGAQFLHTFNLLDDFYLTVGSTKYLAAEGLMKPFLTPGGYFARSDATAQTGSRLRDTYYALAAQKIFIDFDTGQTFGAYYTEAQRQSIVNFVLQSVIETPTEWYGAPDSPQIGKAEATFYCYGILGILGYLGVNGVKLTTFMTNCLDPAQGLGFTEIGFLGRLAQDVNIYLPYTPAIHSHSDTLLLIESHIAANKLNSSFALALSALTATQGLVAFQEYSPMHVAGREYRIKISAGDWVNMQPLTNVVFWGQLLTQDADGIAQKDYTCPFNPWNPTLFTPTIEFFYKGAYYSIQLAIAVSYSYSVCHWVSFTAELCYVYIDVSAYPAVYQSFLPAMVSVQYEEFVVHSAEPEQIAYLQRSNGVNISCFIPLSVFQKFSAEIKQYNITCHFSSEFMADIQIPINLCNAPADLNSDADPLEPPSEPSRDAEPQPPPFFTKMAFCAGVCSTYLGISVGVAGKRKIEEPPPDQKPKPKGE